MTTTPAKAPTFAEECEIRLRQLSRLLGATATLEKWPSGWRPMAGRDGRPIGGGLGVWLRSRGEVLRALDLAIAVLEDHARIEEEGIR